MPAATPSLHRVMVRNTAWNYAGFGANVATNLVAFPWVVGHLGDQASGVWLLLGALTGYMGLLELGLVPSLAQWVAAASGRGDEDGIRRAAATAFGLLLGLALVPLALVAAVPLAVGWLALEPALEAPATLAVQVALAGFALRMPLATLQALLLGFQRQDRTSQLWILMGWARFAAAIVVLGRGGGLVALVTAETAIQLAGGILQWKWVRDERPGLSVNPRTFDPSTARALVRYGLSLLVLGLTTLVIEQTDRLVIAAFLPVAEVTMYAAAWKLFMLVYAVPTTLVQAVAPAAGLLHGRGDGEALRSLVLRGTRYALAVALPLMLSVAACRAWILDAWLGPRYVEAGAVVLVLLGGFYVTAHNHAAFSVLGGMRAIGPLAWRYSVPQAVLNLVFSVALVRPLGILGVAIGTLVPIVLLQPVFVRMVSRAFGLDARTILREVVAPTTLVAAVCFTPLLAAVLLLPPLSPWRPVVAAACSLVFAGGFWLVGLAPGERVAMRRLLRGGEA